MFAVLYRFYLKPGREEEYKQAWNKIVSYFVTSRGAIGSCLHRTEEGLWCAYSRWPDKKTRDASWSGENTPSSELPDEIREAIITVKDCSDEERKFPEICMDVMIDLLLEPKLIKQ